jgi:hypothetical protein
MTAGAAVFAAGAAFMKGIRRMTPELFRARLASPGLTVAGFAGMTCQHPVTCANWGKPRSGRDVKAFPAWALILLRLLEQRERANA